jgi:hypothetical protein
MGYIKEPFGVDFIIQRPPLINEEKNKISNYIKKQKEINKQNLKEKTIKKQYYNA